MRAVARLAVTATVFGAVLGSATPAPAAADVAVTAEAVTYVPQITTTSNQQPQDFTVTSAADVKVVLTTDAPGGMVLRSESAALHDACTTGADGSITCLVPGGPDKQTIEVGYTDGDLDDAVATKTTATFTTTMVVKPAAGGATITSTSGAIKVRPSADLWIGDTAVQGLSSSSYALRINLDNRGPSGSTTTTATVSGFQSRPPGVLPTGCGWTGLTVVCVHHAPVNVDDSRVVTLPLVAAQRGCAYTIHISGPFPDPNPVDNTRTYQAAAAPCTTTTPSPSNSPTATPTPTPSPSASIPPPSPTATPSGPPSGTAPVAGLTGTAPGTPLTAPSPTSGGGGHAAVIAFSVALAAILIGAILAVVALRRCPPDGGGGDDATRIRY